MKLGKIPFGVGWKLDAIPPRRSQPVGLEKQ
jgi:hypothetical protein